MPPWPSGSTLAAYVVGARQDVVELRARQTFHRLELVERGVLRQGRGLVEDDRDRQVGIHAKASLSL